MNPSPFYLKKIAGIIFGLLFLLTTAQAASFDCGKAASKVEKLICLDDELSKLDDALFVGYQAAYTDSTSSSQKRLKSDQQRWLRQRNTCRDRACIKTAYEARLTELNISRPLPEEATEVGDGSDSECPIAHCTRFASAGADKQLWDSAVKGDTAGAKAALARGAAPNVCGPSYQRPLHMAVNNHNVALIRELLHAKANPNVRNCPGNTPLVLAVHDNDIDITLLLLASGADIELGSETGPLDMAAYHGYVNMLKALLSHGANPNAVRGNSTALLLAARNGHVEAVQALLEAGANPNLRDSFGGTALFDAVGAFQVVPPKPEEQERALKVVKLLVQYGADVNAKTAGQSPLQRARALNESAIVEYLTAAGAKP